MKLKTIHIAEWLYSLSFLLFLLGSSLTHIEHGSELSLWLMSFAVFQTIANTLLPLAGIRWLSLNRLGNPTGFWVAMILQWVSWMTFLWAMFQRLGRNLPPFHVWIIITTLLWATWLLVFIFSRHAHQG